jgi:poly-gamma-glutamate capsule biosynthesis protein CapA/YwtB (metallophosphatase superfamily)
MKINRFIFIIFILSSILHAGDNLSITIGGDVMLDRGIRKEIKKQGHSNFLKKYEEYFNKSDYGIVNLESAVTGVKQKTPKKFNFNADFESLVALKAIGVSHINLANNHSIDFGSCGLKETIVNTKKAELIPLGYSDSSKKYYKPTIIEKNGIRVAVFSSVMLKLPDYSQDTCRNVTICHQFPAELCKNISEYRKKFPNDFILLLLHWGWEDTLLARQSQIVDAEKLIKSGADLIVGCHPHVLQNIKKIHGKYVYFSIGNMIFDGKPKKSMILKVKFMKHKKLKIKHFNLN